MGCHRTLAPLLPNLDPIRRPLRQLFGVDPDRFAIASAMIREICQNVRGWVPAPLAEGEGWHARYAWPGVALDFVYGFTCGTELLTFVALGCSHSGFPFQQCSHLGYVRLDLLLLADSSTTLSSHAFVQSLWTRAAADPNPARREGVRILAGLLGLALDPAGMARIAHVAVLSRPVFTIEPWLPGLYLPAHVPRIDRCHSLCDHRPGAGQIRELDMKLKLITIRKVIFASSPCSSRADARGGGGAAIPFASSRHDPGADNPPCFAGVGRRLATASGLAARRPRVGQRMTLASCALGAAASARSDAPGGTMQH